MPIYTFPEDNDPQRIEQLQKMKRLMKPKENICFATYQQKNKPIETHAFNKQDTNMNFKMMRDLAKVGKVRIHAGNHRELDIKGKKYYTLCLSTYDNGQPIECLNEIMLLFSTIMHGQVWFFKAKKNRDEPPSLFPNLTKSILYEKKLILYV